MRIPALSLSLILSCLSFFFSSSCAPESSNSPEQVVVEEQKIETSDPITNSSSLEEKEELPIAPERTETQKSQSKAKPVVRVEEESNPVETVSSTNTNGETLMSRFDPPAGFERLANPKGSFGYYLQHLPLKPEGTQVKYYNGAIKENRGVYVAVIDLDVGKRDLQQCADAVMRLRGEYLWHQKKYDQIHFNFTNGFRVDYDKYRQGYRIKFEGNKTSWRKSTQANNSYSGFRKYMDLIFAYAGTASLEKELKSAALEDLQIGDVFIKGGFPGHAVIVVDVAAHQETGEKIFLLAQSYMPAQEIQILQNPYNNDLSPWYTLPEHGELHTPEWSFYNTQPKRF